VALDRDLDVAHAVEEVVDGSPCPAGDDRRGRAELDEAFRERALGPAPTSAFASTRFGVTTVASGKRRATSV
jgi:hypothetical protein